jgi:hypothetical protein
VLEMRWFEKVQANSLEIGEQGKRLLAERLEKEGG